MSDEYEVYLEERAEEWWAQILKRGVFLKWKSADSPEEALNRAAMWIALDSMPRAPVKRYRWDGISLVPAGDGTHSIAGRLTEVLPEEEPPIVEVILPESRRADLDRITNEATDAFGKVPDA